MTSDLELTGVQFNRFDPGARRPLLVVGPSLGTSVVALWGSCVARLTDRFQVIGWDLPGHGDSPAAKAAFNLPTLAATVLALVDDVLAERGELGGSFVLAGDSVAGAVGLQLLVDHPGRVSAAAVICSGARIGTPEGWHERIATVRAGGTAALVEGSTARWFGSGFVDREPAVAGALLDSLRATDAPSYAWVCAALAGFDVRSRLAGITVPVLAVAGAEDVVTPPASAGEIASRVQDGSVVVLDGVAHLAPAEAPAEIARLLVEFVSPPTWKDVHDAGMRVRREVLGDAHVDRAIAATTGFTREFQEFITQYAWGTIWTRPGLDRRSRSMITLTALIAQGQHEELAMHVRAARTNGLTNDEIKEVFLQAAIYCGVPAANSAFRIAQPVLHEMDG
jgi:3-oxoadipate enol-lactonase/4-carboxymuconolactone decarboxylase